jgi:predicted dehydrogenase
MRVGEVDELEQAARDCPNEYWPMVACAREGILQAIRNLVEAGTLGHVAHVVAQKSYPYHGGRPQDRGVDGGLIRQAGIHGVRFIQWATGQKAVRVSGFDTMCGNPGEGELQMAASVALELDGGAVAVLTCNYLNPKGIGYWGDDQVRVSGTSGMAEARDGFTRCRMVLGEEAEQPIPGRDEPYPDFFDSLVGHLLHGVPMPYSLADDLHALRTVCRAQEAVDAGEVMEV